MNCPQTISALAIQTNRQKMIDQQLQTAGIECGIDVEALIKKYSGNVSLVPSSNNMSQRNGNILEQVTKKSPLETAMNVAHGETKKSTDCSALDRIHICQRCHGYGFVKEIYNHQVHEVNCEVCDGAGIVEKK